MKKLNDDNIGIALIEQIKESGNISPIVENNLPTMETIKAENKNLEILFNSNPEIYKDRLEKVLNEIGLQLLEDNKIPIQDVKEVLSNNVMSPELEKKIKSTLKENRDVFQINDNSNVCLPKEIYEKVINGIEKHQEKANAPQNKKSLSQNNRKTPKPKNN
jgi:hypothetical protein